MVAVFGISVIKFSFYERKYMIFLVEYRFELVEYAKEKQIPSR